MKVDLCKIDAVLSLKWNKRGETFGVTLSGTES